MRLKCRFQVEKLGREPLLGIVITFQNLLAAPPAARFSNDRILVKPKDGIPLPALAAQHARVGSRVLRAFPRLGHLQVVKLPAGASVANMIAAYQKSGLVAFAEPDHLLQLLMESNDFHYANGDLWHLKNIGLYGGTPGADIRATEDWDIQKTASEIIVAVIDSGTLYTHEDLAPNLWINPGETGVDASGNDKRSNGATDVGSTERIGVKT
ncbi:MAG: hypothetical protein HY735_22080 [Verrucomicrobia bacterium]|nr:hypothetical protein [Verrucomicrobiota bacterium]